MSKITLRDGAQIAYDDYNFVDPWTVAEPMIFLHGFSKNRKFWFDLVPSLARRFRMICMDQRGHNESDPLPADFRMSLRPFADDLAAFMDAMRIESAHVVLAEFSSLIAIEFAVRYPERIRSLIMPGFNYDFTRSKIDRADWVKLIEREGAAGWARATNNQRLPANADPKMQEWYVNQQARMPDWVLISLFTFNRTLNLTHLLPMIKAPTLIIAGAAAGQLTPETLHEGVALIPDCKLELLDGMPFNVMSASPLACVTAIHRFLDDIEAKRRRDQPELG